MATVTTMRDKLSEEIGDYFKSTTTSDGSGTDDLIDTELAKYDDDDFIDKFETSFLIEGAVTATGEENFATSKTDGTVAFRGDYSALIPNATAYSVHKLFSAAHKDRVIESVRKSIFPTIFKEAQYEFTIVANQQTYDISAASFDDPLGAFRDIQLVNEDDSEKSTTIFNWEFIPGQTNKLRLNALPGTGRTVRLIGIQTADLADYDEKDENLLIPYVARNLFRQGILAAPGDVASRSSAAKTDWEEEIKVANRKYKKIPPAILQPRRKGGTKLNWSTP